MKLLLLLLLSSLTYGQQVITTGKNIKLVSTVLDVDLTAVEAMNEMQTEALLAANRRIDDLETVIASLPTSEKVPKTISTSTYTVVQSDNNTPLLISNTCKISFSASIKMPFTVRIHRRGGDVTFTGVNINSKFNYKRIQAQWGWVTVTATSTGIVSLSGDLKP